MYKCIPYSHQCPVAILNVGAAIDSPRAIDNRPYNHPPTFWRVGEGLPLPKTLIVIATVQSTRGNLLQKTMLSLRTSAHTGVAIFSKYLRKKTAFDGKAPICYTILLLPIRGITYENA